MKYFLIAVLAYSLLCCQNSSEPDIEKIKKGIRKGLDDIAFKDQKQYKIYELEIFKVDRVGDSIKFISQSQYYQKAFDFFLEKAKETQKFSAEELDLYENLKSVNIPSESHRLKSREYIEKANALLDSAMRYSYLDSLVKVNLKKVDQDSAKYFKVKTFIKASFGSENMLDTMYFLLDKEYRLVPNY